MYCSIMILKDTDRKEVYIVKTARREIEGRPVLAVCYDFDRTLSPENMQDGYIRAVDYDVDSFWEESNRLAEDHCMDQNLAYMYKMLQSARGKEILNKERLKQYGARSGCTTASEDGSAGSMPTGKGGASLWSITSFPPACGKS